MEHIYLNGSEQVGNAGAAMKQAASTIQNAANQFDESIQRQQRFMDDWLERFEQVLKNHEHTMITGERR